MNPERRDVVESVLAGDSKASRRLLARTDPDEAFSLGIKQIVTGFGFLAAAIALYVTNVAGGSVWWWAMLFPGFSILGAGISSVVRANRLEKRQRTSEFVPNSLNQIGAGQVAALPPNRTDYVPSESTFKTGDLAPPSVTEDSTRHLTLDNEGETMTLPKK
ncbi:MAG TPA: hypothetical protein PKM58_04700 [Pyrinomonadaceae bacterium]|nr:hypothetical protein [Pyrinomonadaceae bacterium]HNU07239.1 hypothetical protein [Pyrinomonadaceae bacterium]